MAFDVVSSHLKTFVERTFLPDSMAHLHWHFHLWSFAKDSLVNLYSFPPLMSHILHQVSGGVLLGRDGENMCTCTLVDKYPKVE